jgi:beta-lactamase regulating signal transducer with metallopeptidase domain
MLLGVGLGNALAAAALAPLAAGLGRASRRPAWAHGLWLLVLVRLLAPPLARLPVDWPEPERRGEIAAVATAQAPEPIAMAAMGEGPAPAVVRDEDEIRPVEMRPAPAMPTGGVAHKASWAVAWPSWRVAVGMAWLAGSAAWTALAVARMRRFGRSLRDAKPAPEGLREEVEALARRLGLARAPEVVLVPGGVCPLIWAPAGRNPRLVVPADLWARLDADQRATLLVHELAHLRRRDHWVRPLELLATALYWWHPAVWWARRGLRRAEEQCCDAWVVWALPDAGHTYATTLLEAVDFLSGARPRLPLGASGMGRVRDLSRRITMIMRGETPRALSWAGSLALLGLAALLIPWLPTWGQTKSDEATRRAIVFLAETGNDRPDVASADAPPSPDDPAGPSQDDAAPARPGAAAVPGGQRPADPTAVARARVGDKLIEDARDEVELIEAQLEAKRAQVKESAARAQRAGRELARMKSLRDRKIVGEDGYSNAESEVVITEAQLAAKEAELREPEVRLRQARRRLAALEAAMQAAIAADPARAAQAPRPDATRQTVNNLKQIALALHNYVAAYQDRLPPPYLASPDGRPLLSWRVALLPFLDAGDLYNQFHLDEPWDSPHNKTLLEKMPQVYRSPGLKLLPGTTAYLAITGPQTGWVAPDGARFQEFLDGTSNTLMVVEAGQAVPWTKPEDLPFAGADPADPGRSLGPITGALFGRGFYGVFADGSVRFFKTPMPDRSLVALITKAGGEVLPAEDHGQAPGAPAGPGPGPGGRRPTAPMAGAAPTPPIGHAEMMSSMMRGAMGGRPAQGRGSDADRRIAELEKKLDLLLQEVRQLRQEQRSARPPGLGPNPDRDGNPNPQGQKPSEKDPGAGSAPRSNPVPF